MRMTLLEMVQDILSALDSDEVNSISDSTEALQVATAIKHAYNDIISRANLPEHFELFELNASLDINQPTIMHLPKDVMTLMWVKYDVQEVGDTEPTYRQINYLTPDDFFQRVLTLQDQNQNDVVRFTIDGPNDSSIDIVALNNKAPDYYTSFDDRMLIFDSFNNEVDGTLMKNKTICYGELQSGFEMVDDFTPDLDPRHFSLLYNEAKASCFADLKQVENARAETKVRKGWITLQNQKSSIPAAPSFFDTTPNYGRKGFYGNGKRRGYYN